MVRFWNARQCCDPGEWYVCSSSATLWTVGSKESSSVTRRRRRWWWRRGDGDEKTVPP